MSQHQRPGNPFILCASLVGLVLVFAAGAHAETNALSGAQADAQVHLSRGNTYPSRP